jgi:hypothetical protein
MRSLLRPLVAWLWLTCPAVPASAQFDSLGGPVEFRAPDRPISSPTLGGLEESKSSDLSKFLSPGLPSDVLKRIDGELGRTPTGSRGEAEAGRRESTAKVGDRPNQRGLEGSTFR